MSQPRAGALRLSSVPPPELLDEVLSSCAVAVLDAPPPARVALLAAALERGTPCYLRSPAAEDAEALRALLLRARAQRTGVLLGSAEPTPEQLRALARGRVEATADPASHLLSEGSRAWLERDLLGLSAGLWSGSEAREEGPSALPVERPPELQRLEERALREGLRAMVYLTVPVQERDAWVSRWGGLTVREVHYRLEHDGRLDVRRRVNCPPSEATHVDLFASREAAAAERAREIYLDPRGPSTALEEMGDLLGYPRCCVRAFATLADRSNNTLLRYAAWARTTALGYRFEPALDNLALHLLPWFPCTYACAPTLERAERWLAMLERDDAPLAAQVRAQQGALSLYFEHARQVAFYGAAREGNSWRYERAVRRGHGPLSPLGAELDAALARGSLLALEAQSLEVRDARGALLLRQTRAPGAPGRLFAFERAEEGAVARG